MKKVAFIASLFLQCCYQPKITDSSAEPVKDQESFFVHCSHPLTQYEAQFDVGYYAKEDLKKAEILLKQGERIASVELFEQRSEQFYWYREFNLFEFSCTENYEFYFIDTVF